MEEIRVASWSELQERLFDHSWNEERDWRRGSRRLALELA
jgi:hypothetical protein